MTTDHAGTLDRDKLFTARLHAGPTWRRRCSPLHVVESRRVPTMAVDRYWRCYVSPAFVDRTPVEELAGVWVHEVSHLLRHHHGRGDRVAWERGLTGPGERLRMNIAADCEITDDVFGDGLARPEGSVEPSSLLLPQGQLMEDYLRQFRLGPRTQHLAWTAAAAPTGCSGSWTSDRTVRTPSARRNGTRCGSGWRRASPPDRENVPQGWRRWAQQAFHPPQPWRELLGAAVRSAVSAPGVGEDYTYGRPSRRSAGIPGVVLPALRRRPPRVCVIIRRIAERST